MTRFPGWTKETQRSCLRMQHLSELLVYGGWIWSIICFYKDPVKVFSHGTQSSLVTVHLLYPYHAEWLLHFAKILLYRVTQALVLDSLVLSRLPRSSIHYPWVVCPDNTDKYDSFISLMILIPPCRSFPLVSHGCSLYYQILSENALPCLCVVFLTAKYLRRVRLASLFKPTLIYVTPLISYCYSPCDAQSRIWIEPTHPSSIHWEGFQCPCISMGLSPKHFSMHCELAEQCWVSRGPCDEFAMGESEVALSLWLGQVMGC